MHLNLVGMDPSPPTRSVYIVPTDAGFACNTAPVTAAVLRVNFRHAYYYVTNFGYPFITKNSEAYEVICCSLSVPNCFQYLPDSGL
jgi:hypothetical protein